MSLAHFEDLYIEQYLPPLALKRRAQLDVHHLQGRRPMFNLDEATDSVQNTV
jgi:hypothetical protein